MNYINYIYSLDEKNEKMLRVHICYIPKNQVP
jgi:hypothetical protein